MDVDKGLVQLFPNKFEPVETNTEVSEGIALVKSPVAMRIPTVPAKEAIVLGPVSKVEEVLVPVKVQEEPTVVKVPATMRDEVGPPGEKGTPGTPEKVKSLLGADVSVRFPTADRAGMKVFRKGTSYFVTKADNLETALNKKGLKKDDVEDFISDPD